MTTLPVTYGYARASKTDDDSRNLETQLHILAEHGIRDHLISTDVAKGRSLQRPGWQALMEVLQTAIRWCWPSSTGSAAIFRKRWGFRRICHPVV